MATITRRARRQVLAGASLQVKPKKPEVVPESSSEEEEQNEEVKVLREKVARLEGIEREFELYRSRIEATPGNHMKCEREMTRLEGEKCMLEHGLKSADNTWKIWEATAKAEKEEKLIYKKENEELKKHVCPTAIQKIDEAKPGKRESNDDDSSVEDNEEEKVHAMCTLRDKVLKEHYEKKIEDLRIELQKQAAIHLERVNLEVSDTDLELTRVRVLYNEACAKLKEYEESHLENQKLKEQLALKKEDAVVKLQVTVAESKFYNISPDDPLFKFRSILKVEDEERWSPSEHVVVRSIIRITDVVQGEEIEYQKFVVALEVATCSEKSIARKQIYKVLSQVLRMHIPRRGGSVKDLILLQ